MFYSKLDLYAVQSILLMFSLTLIHYNLLKHTSSVSISNVNRTTIFGVLRHTREVKNKNKRLNFDDPHEMESKDYYTQTGITKDQFDELMIYLMDTDLRASKSRSIKTDVAKLLLRCGLINLIWHEKASGI